MSVVAFNHDPHDVSFESFIDAEAIANHDEGSERHTESPGSSAASAPPGSTFSNSARSASYRVEESLTQHPMSISMSTSLPNTPKMASNFSFGSSGIGAHHHDSSLNNLSFEWEDLNGHHHGCNLSQSVLAPSLSEGASPDLHGMPGLAYDSTETPSDGSSWTSTGERRSIDDFGGHNAHHSFDGTSSGTHFGVSTMHGRSLSLNLHDAASSAITDDLNAQAPPQTHSHHPFIKMEPLDHVPFEGAHVSDLNRSAVFDATAPLRDDKDSVGPSEKKRKLEQEAMTHTSITSKNANTSKKATAKRKTTETEPCAENDSTDHQAASSNDADEMPTPSLEDEGHSQSQDDVNSDSSARKPAAKGKKPPPSASQFTESGKPFPVIDTSATHSSLFVPPDTSGLTKREARLVKNRAAAFLSRQRKREQFELLERQCKSICRLTWRMWEVLAGSNADVTALEQTVLPTLLDEEPSDVRDCLEQIIHNQGASIAPTEESIANGTHSSRQDSSPPTDHQTSTSSTQPRVTATAAGVKRDREDESGTTESNPLSATIENLRSELAASQKREIHLRTTLAEERRRWAAAAPAVASPSELDGSAPQSVRPFYPIHTHAPADSLNQLGNSPSPLNSCSERVFREGRSAGSGLSLTIAPQLTAEDVNAAVTPTANRFMESDKALPDAGKKLQQQEQPETQKHMCPLSRNLSRTSSYQSVVSSPAFGAVTSSVTSSSAGTRRGPSGMALMVLLFGFALFGSGGLPASPDTPKVGITRLSSMNGAFSSVGNVFDLFASPSAPDPLGFLHRKRDDEEEDEEMDANDGRPSSHLSASDLALHLPTSVASQLDDVADLLPMCTLDDTHEGSEGARQLLQRFKSGDGKAHRVKQHMQNAFILLGDEEDHKARENVDEQASVDHDTVSSEGSAPRTLKLFLAQPRRGSTSAGNEPEDIDVDVPVGFGETSPYTAVSSPTSSQSEDLFEDANVRTPTSTSSELHAVASQRMEDGKGFGDGKDERISFLELEFSLSGRRLVKDQEELAHLFHKAAAQRSQAVQKN